MKIVIPMSGFGERFRRAGFTVPKPLIEVDGKPIIGHVLDMFPGEKEVLFICNREHLENPEYRMEQRLSELCPTGSIFGIEPHKCGPVYAVLQASAQIRDDEPVIVNYCDFSCYWDFNHFTDFVIGSGCDGCIPAYRGFHPHMLGPTNYAFIKDANGKLLDIQEKKPFTDNRMSEFASSGTYYFRSGALLKEYGKRTIDSGLKVGDEYYVSLMYRPMAQDGLTTLVYELQHFMQWGTPEDLAEYKNWSSVFRDLARPRVAIPVCDGTLLLPMAGAGSRFAQEGYVVPKPIIPVSGRPMVVQAASDLPPMNEQVFVLRKDLPGLDQVTQELNESFPGARQVFLEALTEGQACTCLMGMEGVDLGKPLMIGACDNGMVYDAAEFLRLMEDDSTDVIVWVARGYPGAAKNPKGYGWVDADGNVVRRVSVKVPLADPATDPVILGAFTFKRAGDFVRAGERLIANNTRVNNEFYVDSLINDATELGLNCKILEVRHYLCWGTPNDLRSFEYWQSCFSKWAGHPYELEKDSRIPRHAVASLRDRYAPRTPLREAA